MTETDISKIHEQLDFIYSQKTVDGKEPLAHFIEQAKLAANFTVTMVVNMGLNIDDIVILDLGCGGVIQREVRSQMFNGIMTSHYRPYYLTELSRRGFKPENLIGVDIADPDPELSPLYNHVKADLVSILNTDFDLTEDVTTPENIQRQTLKRDEFIDFLRDSLTPMQFSNLKFITSNNFFGNISPDIAIQADNMYITAFEACHELSRPREHFIMLNFDGPHELSNVPSVQTKQGNGFDIDKKWDKKYSSLYYDKFDIYD